jgi:hypothetical protein
MASRSGIRERDLGQLGLFERLDVFKITYVSLLKSMAWWKARLGS